MTIEENVPLAPLTTFQIGGPARFFMRVKTVEELRRALAEAAQRGAQVLVLGGGSNVLISDKGFDGLVIKIEIAGVEWRQDGEKTVLIAAAGENWDGLVKQSVEKNLWGIENLSGIPGTAGAAPIQNIGAYGVELKDTLEWVEVLDVKSGGIKTFTNSECGFSYRTSRFKKEPGSFVVLRVALALSPISRANISYRDLAETFRSIPQPSLAEIRAAVLSIRSNKFPDLAKEGTAGSFFLNPVVSKELAARLQEQYPQLPHYRTDEGVKLSLAWILDNVLGLRGFKEGRARLFERQPLVVVAEKNGSAEDVKKLSDAVQKKIKETIGIEIEKEVRIF